MRCPVLLLTGFNCGNSLSQKRSTYAGSMHSFATSPIRKYSLSGITGSSVVPAFRAILLPSVIGDLVVPRPWFLTVFRQQAQGFLLARTNSANNCNAG